MYSRLVELDILENISSYNNDSEKDTTKRKRMS
jgi:hypothetical protein